MPVEIRTDTTKLRGLIAALEPRQVSQLLRRVGLEGEARAKAAAPVRTGFHKNTVRSQASEREVILGAGARYSPFLELGTRRMRARPHIVPGLQKAADNLMGALMSIFRRAQ